LTRSGRGRAALAAGLAMGAMLAPGLAHAAPVLRFQVDQKGDFVLLGNTLGQNCQAGVPAPVAGTGTIGACGSNISDTS
jgi:hypothetical protein